MELLKQLLNEIRKPKDQPKSQTKTQVKDKIDLGPGLGPKFDFENKLTGDLTVKPKTKTMDRKIATADEARRRLQNLRIDPEKLRDLQVDFSDAELDDIVSDEEARRLAGIDVDPVTRATVRTTTGSVVRPKIEINTLPVPVTPDMLPAIMSKNLKTIGKEHINPKWMLVRHLPGYLVSAVRNVGRKLFGMYTRTPIEDIQVLLDIGDSPTSKKEVDAVSKYVTSRGTRDIEAEVYFQKFLPGYKPDLVFYNVDGFVFMFARDQLGNYIYSWPLKDSKIHGFSEESGGEGENENRHRLGYQPKLSRF